MVSRGDPVASTRQPAFDNQQGKSQASGDAAEEEQEFLKFLGQDIWNSPYYDDHERIMASLALTASTHNYSFHGIATTGSIV